MDLGDLRASKTEEDNSINWVTASVMVIFHILAVVALFFFTWKASSSRFSFGGFRPAWASAWAITGC